MFRTRWINRLADDIARVAVYLRAVRARIAQLWSRRDPVKVDIALAIVLTVSALLAIWLGGDAPHHKLPASLLAPVMTLPIAVRRRYPLFVGVVVPTAGAI